MKICAEFAFFLTAMLVAISLTILSPEGLAQTQMVLVATGSTMPEPLYVLWGDEYHKVHPETHVRYLAVGTSESANRVLSGTGGDLGGGDAPIPAGQLKEAAHAAVEMVFDLFSPRAGSFKIFLRVASHLDSCHRPSRVKMCDGMWRACGESGAI